MFGLKDGGILFTFEYFNHSQLVLSASSYVILLFVIYLLVSVLIFRLTNGRLRQVNQSSRYICYCLSANNEWVFLWLGVTHLGLHLFMNAFTYGLHCRCVCVCVCVCVYVSGCYDETGNSAITDKQCDACY